MISPLPAFLGFAFGCILTVILAETFKIPKVYDRAVKDCMNGRVVVTVTTDTIYSSPRK